MDLEDRQDRQDSSSRLDGGQGRARRGRSRDPEVDEAIMTAAMDLLAEVGYARLTMDQVAARARVGKASLYLRWPNKVALVAESLQRHSRLSRTCPTPGACAKTCGRSCGRCCALRLQHNARWPP